MKLIIDIDEIIKNDRTRKAFCIQHDICYDEYCLFIHALKRKNPKFTYGSKNDKISKKLIALKVAKWVDTPKLKEVI